MGTTGPEFRSCQGFPGDNFMPTVRWLNKIVKMLRPKKLNIGEVAENIRGMP